MFYECSQLYIMNSTLDVVRTVKIFRERDISHHLFITISSSRCSLRSPGIRKKYRVFVMKVVQDKKSFRTPGHWPDVRNDLMRNVFVPRFPSKRLIKATHFLSGICFNRKCSLKYSLFTSIWSKLRNLFILYSLSFKQVNYE